MQATRRLFGLMALATAATLTSLPLGADPVIPGHPRILLTPAVTAQLQSRVAAGDPRWLRLKALADELRTYAILPYKWATRTDRRVNTIFYDYQGEGWYSAAMPLALAYRMTGDTSYANHLLALVDEMVRAQSDPDNMPPRGLGPLVPDNYYSTRNLCPVLAIAYDWCYDRLGAARKAAIVGLMNTYFVELHDSAYQRNDHADGNYFAGHLFGAAMMGFASAGDNPKAQEMIDWARQRFDGTTSPLVDAEHTSEDFFAQLFEGGTRPQPAREYNGPYISAAPHKGGFHLQGWAYGSATYNWMIDYMLTVRSATGEDLLAGHRPWLSQMLRALKSGLMPNRFEIDPSGDYGGNYGAVIFRSLPVRLAYALAGTPDGPAAQHFAYEEIAATSPYPVEFPDDIYQSVYQPTEWEDFIFGDATRPSTELTLPPYYTGFAPVYPGGGTTNGALPFFYMRSDWGPEATWASIHQGGAWYDDHQHWDAGHLQIKHANDYLLVDASNWKGDTGSIGIVGSSQNAQYNAGAAANTLFFDDYGDYQFSAVDDSRFCGGQGGAGRDIVGAAEMTDDYSYIRSDLSTAYDHGSDTTDIAVRKLEYFNRSFAYLRAANVFVVFDQTKALASSNPRGEYRRHLRWHFPSRPVVNGRSLSMTQRASRLEMFFLLPESIDIATVDETRNPDPCDGTDPGCAPYGFNSGTWRAEVRDASASRTSNFLTVLEPTTAAGAALTATRLASTDGAMAGAKMSVPGKGDYVMMFNTGTGATAAPVASVTYPLADASRARHTLAGMKPSTRYAVTITDALVTVVESPSGAYTASPAGVLQFGTTSSGIAADRDNDGFELAQCHPNPFDRSTTIAFALPRAQHVTLRLYDALGRAVRTLVDAELTAGRHTVELGASGLANGVYSYTLQGSAVLTGRCVVAH